MFKNDIPESNVIVDTVLTALLSWTATRGRSGAELRAAVGSIKTRAPVLLRNDAIADPLIECFGLARVGGITLWQLDKVRQIAVRQTATSVGAILTKDTMIQLTLATMGQVIAATRFTSRQDVTTTKELINNAFAGMEEIVADEMDSIMYRALIGLHAAIIAYLTETARPLPRMLAYQFNTVMTSLGMSYRLYADASRADELRNENKVVHPAFMPRTGIALSS